jgi:hypothetical protein
VTFLPPKLQAVFTDDVIADRTEPVLPSGPDNHPGWHSLENGDPALIDVTDGDTPNVTTTSVYYPESMQRLWGMIDDDETELSTDVPTLHRELGKLRDEVRRLRKADLPGNGTELWPTLHVVTCPHSEMKITYLEQPTYMWQKQHDHLQGQRIVQQTSWERRHPEKPFVVCVHYHCVASKRSDDDGVSTIPLGSNINEGPISTTHETVHITSTSLLESLTEFFNTSLTLKAYWAGGVIDENKLLHRPYYFFHHVSNQLRAFNNSLASHARRSELGTFIEYISAQSALANAAIVGSSAFRQVALSNLPFLFAPGVLLVTDVGGIQMVVRQRSVINMQVKSREAKPWLAHGKDVVDISCVMEVSEIQFDGRFWAKTQFLQFKLSKLRHQFIAYDELDHLPLSLSPMTVRDALIRRGQKLFDCRFGLYVTCDAEVKEAGMGSCIRYMVDADAYRVVHERENGASDGRVYGKRDAMEELFTSDQPEDDFLLQLPPYIQGFDMQAKTWNNILTADINPVVWDKDAFGNLAIQTDTKELIHALIRNKIRSDQSIDFVKGKGTGLIVLLHGGPGTGKTLTAETVAEIAERPLYRVTCGALGTTATEVEKNLESVFHLGRRWGCVVLLDEADVFLEERALSDLARNALVSVFLRVIEYFDGIMILTSNRVATFDEAFKSRIQLALHYQPLDETQKLQIWRSFVRNLESVDELIDVDEIKSHIPELVKYDLNGRQIRNAINTARQLARFKEEVLNFEHLRRVIQLSGRFDEYLRKVIGAKDDEHRARENAIR